MRTISLTGLQTPADRRWEHKDQPFPAEGVVLRQAGDIVAASPVESGAPGVGVWDTGTGELLFWDAWMDTVRFLRAGMLIEAACRPPERRSGPERLRGFLALPVTQTQ